MSKKIQEYSNDEITVTFDPNICEHAAKCVIGMKGVFKPKEKPWIQLENGAAEEIAKVIETCPSGALQYKLKSGKKSAGMEVKGEATQINLVKNGPARISGNFKLMDADGNLIETKDRMSLCRCGQSKTKPFCDGTHLSINFQG